MYKYKYQINNLRTPYARGVSARESVPEQVCREELLTTTTILNITLKSTDPYDSILNHGRVIVGGSGVSNEMSALLVVVQTPSHI